MPSTARIDSDWEYAPQVDITAYELALLLPVLLAYASGHPIYDRQGRHPVEALPDEVRRHFRERVDG